MDMRVGYVNIGVRDLDRAIAFYRDVLAFGLVFAAPEFHYARFDVGGLTFGVAASDTDSTGSSSGDRHTGIGLVVADVDAVAADLMAKGVRFTLPPGRQPWGGYMGMFADPDGNVFYLDQAA